MLKFTLFLNCLIIMCFLSKSIAQQIYQETKTTQEASLNGIDTDTTSNYHLFNTLARLDSTSFTAILDSIQNGQSDDFFTLRLAFTKTRNYDPYNSDISEIHDEIEKLIDSQQYEKALEKAHGILENKYVDIKSHLFCSFIYRQLGDSLKTDYHYYFYNGLQESIYLSGDGKSPQTAFIVIEIAEEYDLLGRLRMKYMGQRLVREDNYPFDLVKAFDRRQDREVELYFNIRVPFLFISH